MLTDEERTELHRRLVEIQREEDRRVLLAEEERALALGVRAHPLEPAGPPPRMR